MHQKVKQVENVFKEMDNHLARFKKVTQVNCPQGCILCCLKPDLEANVLEFLPLAWHLVKTGMHEEVLEKIESGQTVCVSLNTIRADNSLPGCKFYPHRGAICRLFGSAALRNNKTGRLTLYTCRTLKDNYAGIWTEMETRIGNEKNVPMVPDYYYRLIAIDPILANDYNPINKTIYKAIGKVMLWFSHRPKPNSPFGKAM